MSVDAAPQPMPDEQYLLFAQSSLKLDSQISFINKVEDYTNLWPAAKLEIGGVVAKEKARIVGTFQELNSRLSKLGPDLFDGSANSRLQKAFRDEMQKALKLAQQLDFIEDMATQIGANAPAVPVDLQKHPNKPPEINNAAYDAYITAKLSEVDITITDLHILDGAKQPADLVHLSSEQAKKLDIELANERERLIHLRQEILDYQQKINLTNDDALKQKFTKSLEDIKSSLEIVARVSVLNAQANKERKEREAREAAEKAFTEKANEVRQAFPSLEDTGIKHITEMSIKLDQVTLELERLTALLEKGKPEDVPPRERSIRALFQKAFAYAQSRKQDISSKITKIGGDPGKG